VPVSPESLPPMKKISISNIQYERQKRLQYQVTREYLENRTLIVQRVNAASTKSAGSLRTVLSYLYLADGPTNLRNSQYKLAEPNLRPFERVLARYLKSRTNGRGRRTYGKPALTAARKAHYRCQVCGERDVRTFNLDHVHGTHDTNNFFLLCANCHHIKGRMFDWTGK